jgi:hypothetical protein
MHRLDDSKIKDLSPRLINVIIKMDLKLRPAQKKDGGYGEESCAALVLSEVREREQPECSERHDEGTKGYIRC